MKLTVENKRVKYYLLGSLGVVFSCGVRARKALFYKDFAGSYFLSGSVKNRHFERKWCSKWCSKRGKIDRCFLNVELWDKVVNGIII